MTRASAQLTLLDWTAPNARARDPDTSIDAANAHPLLRHTDRRAALMAHREHRERGLTDFELGDILGRQQTSAGKRRGELRDLGLIEQTEERRAAPSGSLAIVWRITQDGLRFARELNGED